MKSNVRSVRSTLTETEFERLRDRIDLEASHAADHLHLLRGLVASRADYYLEMNESNTFWHLTFKAHLNALLSHLCLLYDKTKGALSLGKFLRTVKTGPALFSEAAFRERLKDNPHVDTLYQAIDGAELDKELATVSETDPLVKRLLQLRNKNLSHIDAENVVNTKPVAELTADAIETLLGRARAITSKYSLFYRASTYGGIVGAEDYKSTLQWLRKALSSHQAEIAEETQRANDVLSY